MKNKYNHKRKVAKNSIMQIGKVYKKLQKKSVVKEQNNNKNSEIMAK